MSESDREDEPTRLAFEVTFRDLDLDQDGRDETLAWISSWGGTSGQSLFVLKRSSSGYDVIFRTDATWTPIILLESTTNGWFDLAYLRNGGGVEQKFIMLKYNRRTYELFAEHDTLPKGIVLIDKGWDQTVFGPSQ